MTTNGDMFFNTALPIVQSGYTLRADKCSLKRYTFPARCVTHVTVSREEGLSRVPAECREACPEAPVRGRPEFPHGRVAPPP